MEKPIVNLYGTTSKGRSPLVLTAVYAIPASIHLTGVEGLYKVRVGLACVLLLSKLGWKCVLRRTSRVGKCVEGRLASSQAVPLGTALLWRGFQVPVVGHSIFLPDWKCTEAFGAKEAIEQLAALFEKAQNSQERRKGSLWMVRMWPWESDPTLQAPAVYI